jgi:N-acetyl-anhydromuramyl-L-alanine amidase AmpD
VRAVIVHTTGETNHEKILSFYKSETGYQPHWYVATNGDAYRIVDEARVAYHCAMLPQERTLYGHGFAEWSHWIWKGDKAVRGDEASARYVPWKTTWPAIDSPLELATGERPNSASVGIELQQPVKPTDENFTVAQYEALCGILSLVKLRHGIKLDREHVLGHADCSPLRRCKSTGPWDPPMTFNWGKVLSG